MEHRELKNGETYAGRYELIRKLGDGGYADVWLATEGGQEVAIKMLKGAATEGTAHERFEAEGLMLSGMKHRHILRYIDWGYTEDGAPYLVTEYIRGADTLKSWLRRRALRLDQVVEVILQINEGLAYLHAADPQVVHRDLKPGNVLVYADGNEVLAKIIDFGLAKWHDDGLTKPGDVFGTAQYMAPEQVMGLPAGPAADIYALGCIAYEALSGHPPFAVEVLGEKTTKVRRAGSKGLAESGLVMEAHVRREPVALKDTKTGFREIPDRLSSIVMLMLDKDPKDRIDGRRVKKMLARELSKLPRPLERWGSYEVMRPLGSGGQASVMLGWDPELKRDVALKVVDLDIDEEGRRRFEREGQALAQLRHPNVVSVYATGRTEDGRPFHALEYIAGASLAAETERGRISDKRAMEIGRDVAKALAAAHSTGVVHRDVKPENILLEEGTKRVVLVDFGIASREDDLEVTKLEDERRMMVSVRYASPESVKSDVRARNAPPVDVYGLGATLFRVLTGEYVVPPGDTPQAYPYLVSKTPRRSLREVREDIPEAVVELIDSLLAFDADARPTAEEAGKRFEELVETVGEYAPLTKPQALKGDGGITGYGYTPPQEVVTAQKSSLDESETVHHQSAEVTPTVQGSSIDESATVRRDSSEFTPTVQGSSVDESLTLRVRPPQEGETAKVSLLGAGGPHDHARTLKVDMVPAKPATAGSRHTVQVDDSIAVDVGKAPVLLTKPKMEAKKPPGNPWPRRGAALLILGVVSIVLVGRIRNETPTVETTGESSVEEVASLQETEPELTQVIDTTEAMARVAVALDTASGLAPLGAEPEPTEEPRQRRHMREREQREVEVRPVEQRVAVEQPVAQEQEGEVEPAADSAEVELAADPVPEPVVEETEPDSADELIARAERYDAAGREREANSVYREFLSRFPEDGRATRVRYLLRVRE